MTSGVPRGSILGPVLFLAYINDLPLDVVSQVRLFAEDTAKYLTTESQHDSDCLQRDLDLLQTWESKWDMEYNPSKCQVIRVTTSRAPFNTKYILHGQVLEVVTSARYLGVDISSNLSWNTRVDRVTANANRSLRFIKRNVKAKSPGPRNGLSDPCTSPAGVASAIWDPHTKRNNYKVEMVQRCAARWTMNDYARTTSVSSLLHELDWQTLAERRSVARLCLFYKVVNGLVAVPLPDYIQPRTHRISKYCHSMTFRQIHTFKDSYKYSFPLAIVQWNTLPETAVTSPSLDSFKAEIGKLQFSKS